ncbi:MAG: hypothetical protein AAGI38_07135 [Bacteroidota bacterium]
MKVISNTNLSRRMRQWWYLKLLVDLWVQGWEVGERIKGFFSFTPSLKNRPHFRADY